MPARTNYYSPDAIDVNTIVSAIGNDFGCLCSLSVEFRDFRVIVYAKCGKLVSAEADKVEVQAMCARPLKPAPDLAVMFYAAALDCWHQLDRGILAVAGVKVSNGWNGRPATPRARNKQ